VHRLTVAAALAPAMVEALAAVPVLLLGVVALNRDLFAFLGRQRGCLFALRCIPLHLLYYLYSGVSYVYVCVEAKLPARMSTPAASSSSERAAEPYRDADGTAPQGGPSRHAPRGLARLWARWTVIAHIIGNFQARVVLTLFYFLIVPPFAIVLKALKDPLTLKTPSAPQPPGGSFWTERSAEPQLSERGHRQF
jgi:hypothetical protein